jgi:hypothetical protein
VPKVGFEATNGQKPWLAVAKRWFVGSQGPLEPRACTAIRVNAMNIGAE